MARRLTPATIAYTTAPSNPSLPNAAIHLGPRSSVNVTVEVVDSNGEHSIVVE